MVRVAGLGGGRVRCRWSRSLTAGPGALGGTAPLLLIAFLGWQLFWMPSVVVHDAGVTLENPFRSIKVPWAALVHVDTRFALTLVTAREELRVLGCARPRNLGRPPCPPGRPPRPAGTTYGPGKSVRPGRPEDHRLRPGCHAGAGALA